MKILQIVTYISPDGAYGGPVRVAINQAKALTERGHEVTLVAAAGGFSGRLPSEYDGFPVHLFHGYRVIPKTGFAGVTSPSLLAWLPKALKNVDVVHIHLSRDLVTLPAAALALATKKPLVVQAHGMIDHTHKLLAKPLDALLTVPILRAASQILFLTEKENLDIKSVAGNRVALTQLPNGVSIPSVPALEQTNGPSSSPEVMFLARLHAIKRPLTFLQASINLSRNWPSAVFSLIGPDEGEGRRVKAAIADSTIQNQVRWLGPIAPEVTVDRMRESSIFTLPSRSELFSMATLEAMALGLPVVITETSGFAALVRENEAGIVCSLNQDDLEDAICRLLGDYHLRQTMGANGRKAVKGLFSIDKVASSLELIYLSAIASKNVATDNNRGRTY